jgi:2-methylisocitrate lyase-like PEP mutase family enzyme
MPSPGEQFRKLMARGEHFIVAEAYSAMTGRVVEHVGFEAAYIGGHAASAFHYGVPDNGVYSQVEQIEQAARIAHAISIPLIADADTLGETVADAFHFARRYARAGIGGIHVEDEINPKHSRHVNGLCPIVDMQLRIEAAVKGAGDSGMVIIARCDEMYTSEKGGGGTGSVEEAIARGRAYLEAGADALFFPLAGPQGYVQLAAELPPRLCTMGFNLPGTLFNLSTGWGWISAAYNHLAMARELKETGGVASAMKAMTDFPEKFDLIEQDLFDELIVDWCDRTGRPTRSNHAP